MNRIAHDLTRPVVTAMSIKLRARAQELSAQGLEAEEIIDIVSREAMKALVHRPIGFSRKTMHRDA
ncbi:MULTISPECIES: hypothetical protein [unclassified Variovorax]|uniref:hypothetical protein n=2 Tax=unclassified Variovorax TaxID=663243 RepID=UPI00076C9170|nr:MULTISPECIES: hypothetical protein [unclassified Variovorax]KWT83706.1 hypothetical protein APY03_4261 [Variovorax sp. WDL1]